MKKLPVLFIFILFSLQVYAERHFELVELYHIKYNQYQKNGYNYEYHITKPTCKAGGTPEVDPGAMIAGKIQGLPDHMKSIKGEFLDRGTYWAIVFDGAYLDVYTYHYGDKYLTTAKIYCSYPIQCIKQ